MGVTIFPPTINGQKSICEFLKILKGQKFFFLETPGEKNCYRFFEIGVYPGWYFGPMRFLQNDQMMMKSDQIHPVFSENQLVINPVIRYL
jgi:hypothetical protein